MMYKSVTPLLLCLFFTCSNVLAQEGIKKEAKDFYTEKKLQDGVHPFKNGQIIVVTAECENQLADFMFLRKVSELIYNQLGIVSGDLSKNQSVEFIPLARQQSMSENQLVCTIASFIDNQELQLHLSKAEIEQKRIEYFVSVIRNAQMTERKKADFFRKNKIVELAHVYSMRAEESADLEFEPDLDWLNIENDRNGQLKNSYLKYKINPFETDKGDTTIVKFSRDESSKFFQQGNATNFIKWASVLLSRKHDEVDTWKKLSSVLRSQGKYNSSLASLYYAIAYGEVSGYDVMSLALLSNKIGSENAKSLAKISKQLDPTSQWVINNYEKITK